MKNTPEEARYIIIKDILSTLFRFDNETKIFYAWHHEGNFAIASIINDFNYSKEEVNSYIKKYLIETNKIKEGEKFKFEFDLNKYIN